MKNASYIYEVKQNGKWTTTHTCNDARQAYEDLSHELIAKKLCNCTYIRSIKRQQRYTHVEVIVTYTDDCGGGRRVYTIEN